MQFRSLDASATMLDGYLYRAAAPGRQPAVAFLHGCNGMFNRSTGAISALERDWAATLTVHGYSVLMVDSFRPRGIELTCSPATYNRTVVEDRPRDAYGALNYLQDRPSSAATALGSSAGRPAAARQDALARVPAFLAGFLGG